MNSIADALVYATAHVFCRAAEDEDLENQDESAIGHIMAYLSEATPDEENVLAIAAKRALAEEQSLNSPQPEMITVLSKWMELLISRDWDGNDRVDEPSE